MLLFLGGAAAEQTMSHFDDVAAANRAPLDWVNFLLADVQGGVGPFLAVFLTSSQHWQAGAAGMALTVGGIATVLARAPAGELVDVLHAKRTLIALASAGSIVSIALARNSSCAAPGSDAIHACISRFLSFSSCSNPPVR